MDLKIQCESVNVESGRYGTVEVDMSDVSIDDLNHHTVYEMIDLDSFVSHMGSDQFVEYVSVEELISYYGEDEIIKRLSTDAILDHFRDNIVEHLSK